jgi:ubiquinol-cytochrome c reductase cytochrome c1 subunit
MSAAARPLRWRAAGRRLAALGLAAAASLGALAPSAARAGEMPLDTWPADRGQDRAALQRGARLFTTYCLNCHGASLMRWNRLNEIGLDDAQIKANLIFGEQKVGDTMTVAMAPRDAKAWFGKAPPDLSVIIRARNTEEHRGTDYVYTLLRGFYRDDSTLTGWNNIVYPKIAMPNILWQRQGPRTATLVQTEPAEASAGGLVRTTRVYDTDGRVTVAQTHVEHGAAGLEASFTAADPQAAKSVDEDAADIVAFLNWMSEPAAATRYRIGVWAMGFLVVFLLVARWLNKVYWRDVH